MKSFEEFFREHNDVKIDNIKKRLELIMGQDNKEHYSIRVFDKNNIVNLVKILYDLHNYPHFDIRLPLLKNYLKSVGFLVNYFPEEGEVIAYKKKFLNKPKKAYHAVPFSRVPMISKYGILPSGGKRTRNKSHPDTFHKIFLTSSRELAWKWIETFYNNNESLGYDWAIYEVDLNFIKNYKVVEDPRGSYGLTAFYIEGVKVPPQALKLDSIFNPGTGYLKLNNFVNP